MADDNLIGLGRCPVCGQPEARFTISKSRLVVVTCRQRRCGIQLFSRTGDGDEGIRAFLTDASPETAIPQAPAPPPAPTPEPAAPAQTPVPDPAPLVKKSKPGWGILGAIDG